jgi:hypothetical protein
MVEGLTFEAEGHVYRYRGKVVPSVTQILEQLEVGSFIAAIKDALRDRSHTERSTAIARYMEQWQAAAEFGTHVHAACHLYNQRDLIEEELSPALVPYLNQYKRFLRDTGFIVQGSEVLLYHEDMGYAGQEDFDGIFRGTTWAVDIKSGVVPCTVGAQTAAYQQAHPKATRPKRRACLQLMEDDYKFIEQKEYGDFSLFTSALNVFRFNQKHFPRALGAQLGDTHAERISEYA